jgi:hypothetical protein
VATLTKDPTAELAAKLDTWFKELHKFNTDMANEVARLARGIPSLPVSPTGTPTPPPPPKI